MNALALSHKIYLSSARNHFLSLALLPLHCALWLPLEPLFRTGLVTLHIALFILWHPFWLGESHLRKHSSTIFAGVGLLISLSHSWLALSVWLIFIASLLAGEPFQKRRDIGVQILAILYLLGGLFICSLPHSFDLIVEAVTKKYLMIFFTVVLLAIGLFKQQHKHLNIRQADILLSLIFSQVIVITAMGTVLFVLFKHSHYLTALLFSTLSATAIIIVVNFIWKWFSGTTALSFLWNRYLLILGSPFEGLLMKFSALAKTTQSPAQYLEACFAEFIKLDWLEGLHWRAASGRGEIGVETQHQLDIEIADMNISLYAKQPLHGALAVHARLLVHMVTHFYHSIKRERSLAHRAHVQALYETGARLTHDIKNLLQGMKTLSAAGENTNNPIAFHALFVKQIPTINERLETTLRKLTEPAQNKRDKDVMLSEWWLDLQQRYQGRNIELHAEIEIDRAIPDEMFNTVSENLLENARAKRLSSRDIEIKAQLISNPDGIVFSVMDSGYAVPADKAQFLLAEPVRSDQGLGVGLYQSAALAKHQGYELVLETNQEGMVCFALANESK